MVEYDDRDRSNGISITDIDIVDELEEELVEAFEYQKGTASTELGVDNMYVVGSYARGEASPDHSDLDVVISYENLDGDELDPQFDSDKGWVSAGIANMLNERMPWPLKKYFDEVDVLSTRKGTKDVKLRNYFHDTRRYEIEGEPRVYDLTNREYIYEDELDEKVNTDG